MHKVSAIILAAGKGKRMKSDFPKVLREVCGQPFIYYLLKELSRLRNVHQVVVVVGYKGQLVEDAVKNICFSQFKGLTGKIQFVRQQKMLGTADAVRAASGKIKFNEVLVTCGDNPLIKSKTFSSLLSFSRKNDLGCCLLVSWPEKENKLGSVVYDKLGKPMAIEEKISGINNYQGKGVNKVNSGTYYFRRKALLENLSKIKKNRKKKEYFLTDIIQILYQQGKNLSSYLARDFSEVAGINDPFELQFAEKVIRGRIIEKMLEKGVHIINPATTIIQESVKIGKNTIIYPFTFIAKNVIIGSNCSVGPFAYLRGGSRIEKGAQVGSFSEINRSQIGKGSKAKHFGYIGDAVVGDNVNIGAGTVVANYDGKVKHKTYIQKNALIGSDTVLVAPVMVGEGSVTGAGSVVTKNVKKNQVVVGVPARPLKIKEKK